MPVTEFATFKLKSPYTNDDPEVHDNFKLLSTWQSEWSGYPLTFYQDETEPAVLYLISGWKDVSAHMKWIESERNQHLLKVFEPILSITAFTHVEIDFGGIPVDTSALRVARCRDRSGQLRDNSLREDHAESEKRKVEGRSVEDPEDWYVFWAYEDAAGDPELREEAGAVQVMLMHRVF